MNGSDAPLDPPKRCEKNERCKTDPAAPENIGCDAPARFNTRRASTDWNYNQTVFAYGRHCQGFAVDGDLPRRVAAQAQNDESVVIALDFEQLVLILPEVRGVGVVAG